MRKNVFSAKKHGTLLIYQGSDLVGIVNVVPGDVVTIAEDCKYKFEEDMFYSPRLLSRFFM